MNRIKDFRLISRIGISFLSILIPFMDADFCYAQTSGSLRLHWEGPSSLRVGQIIPLQLVLTTDKPLGAYDITIGLTDIIHAKIVEVRPGTSTEFQAPAASQIVPGGFQMFVNDFQTVSLDSPIGDVHILTLMIQGLAAGNTSLQPQKITVLDTNLNEMSSDSDDFQLSIVEGILGDVNDNDRLDIGDAMLISQFLAGYRESLHDLPKFNALCDINQSGECDIGDALMISQILANLVPYPE